MKEEEKVQNPTDEQDVQGQTATVSKSEAYRQAMELIAQTESPDEVYTIDEIEQSEYMIIPGLAVSRECVTKGGKKYYNYYLTGKVRGRDMKAYFRPAVKDGRMDVRAYEILDTVFGTQSRVPFAVRAYKRRDQESKRVTHGLTFHAYVYDDEYGREYAAPLRPDQTSDREILLWIVDEINRRENLGLVFDS